MTTPDRPKRIAIIGAGLRGIASAAYLKRRGHSVRVFEKTDSIGGIWNRVFPRTEINTPSHGYTFHFTNRWRGPRPTRNEILDNLRQMIKTEALEELIELNAPVGDARTDKSGNWTLDACPDPFDAVLVCSGFLGRQREPPALVSAGFAGQIYLPYAFAPSALQDRRVVVVGSGSTAAEMSMVAFQEGARSVDLIVQPGTVICDIPRFDALRYCARANPLVYRILKGAVNRSVAVCAGITPTLRAGNVRVHEGSIVKTSGGNINLADGTVLDAQDLVWCTGWHADVPTWAFEHSDNPTMMIASCQRCLDTAGFGYGTANIHAKILHAILEHGLRDSFRSDSADCNCDQAEYGVPSHIVLRAMTHLLRRPGGLRLLGRHLGYGFRSNMERLHESEEPLYAKLASFVNAPLGL